MHYIVILDWTQQEIEFLKINSHQMNVEKIKVMRISRQPFPVKIMIDQKQLENVESFKYLVAF